MIAQSPQAGGREKTRYTHVRVPLDVYMRLAALAESLERQALQGRTRLPDRGNTGRISCPLWFAIEYSLSELYRHRERAKLARSRQMQQGERVITPPNSEGIS